MQNRLSRFCRDWKIRHAARHRNICPSRRPLGQAPAGVGFAPCSGAPLGKPPPGNANAGSARAARVQPRGCKGRSPLHEITLDSPFPGGEGGWGDRGRKTLIRQENPASKTAVLPLGAGFAPLFRYPAEQAPRWATPTQVQPASPGFSPGDARGEAPCIRKQKSPPSPEGKGVGGMGAGKEAKGEVSRRQRRQAPAGQRQRRFSPRRPDSALGMQGAKPLA